MSDVNHEVVSDEQEEADQNLRSVLEDNLSNGLTTEVEPRAYTSVEVNHVHIQVKK